MFDFIIIGAGSAGCVLANRLSANPNHSVLLLEAGDKDNSPFIHMPNGMGIVMTGCLALAAKGQWPLAIAVYMFALIGFSGANVFYDALLLDAAPHGRIDRVSAFGFALGYLGGGVLFSVNVAMTLWPGSCMVHVTFSERKIVDLQVRNAGAKFIAHPECEPNILRHADFVGSTANMINYVSEAKPERVLLVTECSMSDNVAVEHPEVDFVRPCNLCPHMKRITLPKILDALIELEPRIEIDPAVAERARVTVERMLAIR